MKKPAKTKPRDEFKARPLKLKALVDYARTSVVSKTLVDSKAGTLTLFAFAAGQGLSVHTAPFDAIVQVLDGEAELTIAGKSLRAKTGELVIMPAHIPHAVRAVLFTMLLRMITRKGLIQAVLQGHTRRWRAVRGARGRRTAEIDPVQAPRRTVSLGPMSLSAHAPRLILALFLLASATMAQAAGTFFGDANGTPRTPFRQALLIHDGTNETLVLQNQ
jgi:quercetin dioxygenase-like cupin family protein